MSMLQKQANATIVQIAAMATFIKQLWKRLRNEIWFLVQNAIDILYNEFDYLYVLLFHVIFVQYFELEL